MHWVRYSIFTLIGIVALFKSIYFYSDGFRLDKIDRYLLLQDEAITDRTIAIDPDVKKILSQPFRYLAKGRQSYAFISQDDQYVLKLVRTHKFIKPLWSKHLPWLAVMRLEALEDKIQRHARAIKSYTLASNKLKKASQIITSSFSQTPLVGGPVFVTLVDGIGREHQINLQRVYFILQKKAVSLDRYFSKLIKEKKDKELSEAVDAFFLHIATRAKQKIFNRDYRNAMRNMGWLNNQIIDCDVGSFYEDVNGLSYSEEIDHFRETISHFLVDKQFDIDLNSSVEKICFQ